MSNLLFNERKDNTSDLFLKYKIKKKPNHLSQKGCFVPHKYISNYKLSFDEAGLYSILVGLSLKTGFGYPSNNYLCEQLGMQVRTLYNKIKKLREKNLVYVHLYITRRGKRREITTRETFKRYEGYLIKNKRWQQFKKIKKEFSQQLVRVT